jgi:DNA-binding Lrp family transcriptional regulator
MLDELEKKVIALVQKDIPVAARPYREMAANSEISESELLRVLQDLLDRGVIRRYGATLRHQRTGFTANAMAAWQVEENRIDEVGRRLAAFKEVSHCYRRSPAGDWPYNLYTMIHATGEEACRKIARRMARETGVDSYTLLFSREELKKTSMEYFPSDEED